jgi:hypothetical protein
MGKFDGDTFFAVQASTADDLVHTLKTMEGKLFHVPPRTPRSSGYDVYAHF